MSSYIPWDSQSLDEWAQKFATGKFIDLNGRRTHFLEKGSGEPVILVHGFFYDTYSWHNNIDTLASKFKVYAPDLWGFGYSAREPLDYGYSLYAEQLLLFMDALAIEKASIVGHSMGGGIVIFFANHHRDRINKLVLIGAAGIPNPLPLLGRITNLPGVGELIYGMRGNLMRRLALKNAWIYDANMITDEYLENVTRFHKIRGSTGVMLKILRKQFFHTIPNEVREVGEKGIPTLIVWGKQDKSIPLKCGIEMHNLIKGSRLEILDMAGHNPHDERADGFNPMVIDFLQ